MTSRFDFSLPTKTLPCGTCGQPLVADLNAPEPLHCALCVIHEAITASPRPTPSTARKTKRRAA